MRYYCKQADEGQVSRGFIPEDPANFDIRNSILSSLRENMFDGNAIRDPWAHLARFYKTTSMCKPTDVTENQVKLRLFGFSLIGREKYWLIFLLNGTIQTWKELKDKFLEIFFTTTQFIEHQA
ncbi:uncharacterized protein LOC127102889 [Lathyrus oleraceus]|uniref:uncharacterized protein LOC127102889 n=1 Tax=Pisum sativum TaxID=3888 RepID=UPI0021D12025|nr:uncharacterized protein LOC127102889 [Pisum sativum]